jgi:hypothetical protein
MPSFFSIVSSSSSSSRTGLRLTTVAAAVTSYALVSYEYSSPRNEDSTTTTATTSAMTTKSASRFFHGGVATRQVTYCDAAAPSRVTPRATAPVPTNDIRTKLKDSLHTVDDAATSTANRIRPGGQFIQSPNELDKSDATEEEYYHGLFPLRQLFVPYVEYPLWDDNWDERRPTLTGIPDDDRNYMRQLRKAGVTRHIVLIRHGQYDETHKVHT